MTSGSVPLSFDRSYVRRGAARRGVAEEIETWTAQWHPLVDMRGAWGKSEVAPDERPRIGCHERIDVGRHIAGLFGGAAARASCICDEWARRRVRRVGEHVPNLEPVELGLTLANEDATQERCTTIAHAIFELIPARHRAIGYAWPERNSIRR